MGKESDSLRPDDLKTLQLFSDFDPAPLPEETKAFLSRANRHELQAIFIETFERLRAYYDGSPESTDP